MKKNCFMLVAIALCAMLLIGCNDTTKKEQKSMDQRVTLAFTWSPASLDPHGYDNWEVMRSGTAETLVRLSEEFAPTPWLAKSWQQENETTWLFQLQDNVQFHNGKAMEAESVKQSLERTIAKNPNMKELLQIQSIEVLSTHQLQIQTTQPNAALLSHLADPATIIVDVATVEDEDKYPALTGAYSIEDFKQDESLLVKRFADYWGEQAAAPEVLIKFIIDGNARLMALQAGEVDGATDISVDHIELLTNDFDVVTAPSVRTHFVMYNMTSDLFKQPEIRQVFDTLLPRQEIVDSIMRGQGTVATAPFAPVLPFSYQPQPKAPSVEELLERTGWTKNEQQLWAKDGQVLEATFLTFPQRPELTVIAEAIQSTLLAEGIQVTIRQVDNIDAALEKESWDLSMYSMLTAHTGDPQYFLELFYHSESAANYNHYRSAKVDDLLKQLRVATETEKRNQLAKEIQQEIEQDLPQSFLVFPNTVFAVKKELKGFIANPIEYYYNNAQVRLEK